jgi:hypothetical protein
VHLTVDGDGEAFFTVVFKLETLRAFGPLASDAEGSEWPMPAQQKITRLLGTRDLAPADINRSDK